MRHVLFLLLLPVLACSSNSTTSPNATLSDAGTEGVFVDSSPGDATVTRSFHLGFTPFPYDITQAAVDDVYTKLTTDADLYAFHTTEGVPWVEAGQGLSSTEYGQALRDKWNQHRARSLPSHAVYLGLTPLDDSRQKMADYWGEAAHMPLPVPWDSYDLNTTEVKAAYLSFCREAVRFYEPEYLAIGLEVNLLRIKAPEKWGAYIELHKATYQALKQEFPTLPIFVTFTAVDLLEGWTEADHTTQISALADLLPYSDYLALSLYPYMSAHLTEPLPVGYLDQLVALAGHKPVVIAESGYPAQRTELTSLSLVFEGTEEKQAAFVQELLTAAEEQKMPFVVNFVLQDYDALWEKAGGDDVLAVWRDTGFYSEAGREREALRLWRAALATPVGL
ncbi:MAG: hypothetical protein JRH20_31095 [Deltaproteobacteria bacterium]|nr:hypothetical protein [Deltaproteobacteria bacterium]